MFNEKKVCILYGSQTGNTDAISYEMQDLIEERTSKTIPRYTLNEYIKDDDYINSYDTLIILCSTTGNGDSPENASLFWRKIKNRQISKKLFENISYFVIGLGDSNYNIFCHMGKQIDKRLFELGGKRIRNVTCIDEVDGLEDIVPDILNEIVTTYFI